MFNLIIEELKPKNFNDYILEFTNYLKNTSKINKEEYIDKNTFHVNYIETIGEEIFYTNRIFYKKNKTVYITTYCVKIDYKSKYEDIGCLIQKSFGLK